MLLHHLAPGLLQQQMLRLVFRQHIEQQRGADLQLAASLVLAWHALGHQTTHLGDGPETPAAEFREVHGLFQVGFELAEVEQIVAVELQQFIKGVALGGQQLKAVVVDRHGDGAGAMTGQAPGPEEAEALVHEAPFQGEGEQMAALAAAAHFHQQLVLQRQA